MTNVINVMSAPMAMIQKKEEQVHLGMPLENCRSDDSGNGSSDGHELQFNDKRDKSEIESHFYAVVSYAYFKSILKKANDYDMAVKKLETANLEQEALKEQVKMLKGKAATKAPARCVKVGRTNKRQKKDDDKIEIGSGSDSLVSSGSDARESSAANCSLESQQLNKRTSNAQHGKRSNTGRQVITKVTQEPRITRSMKRGIRET